MKIKSTCLLLLLLIFSVSAYCDSHIQKLNHSSKTVYLAKSDLDDGAWDIRWSTDYAIAQSSVIYSEKKWDNTDSSFVGKIYSIVIPFVSFKGISDGYSEGSAHPWHVTYFSTVDIESNKRVKLTDIFDESEIYKALINDGVIKKALKGQTPKNLEELLKQADGGCDFYLSESSLKSFVFHHVKNDKVAVRLGLKHGCEAMRGKFTQLGFYLTIPKHLKRSFNTAKERGLLMNKMAKLKY